MRDGGASRAVWWAPLLASPAAPWAIILSLLLARVIWLVFVSDLTLLEDEAHYWEWSQRLDWSYYSKGPGTALLIRASTELFGHTEWAVRLPALLASAIGAAGAACAARWTLPEHKDRAILIALSALLYLLIPGFAIASMIMTIDAPYIACWMWAGALSARALRTGSTRAWAGVGLAIALGFLFKYTILLLVIGIILAALTTRGMRTDTAHRSIRGPALAAGLGLLGLIPVLLWNAQHDWATVRHLLGHLGMTAGDVPAAARRHAWSPTWLPEYLILQAFVCGPVLTLAWLGARRARAMGDAPLRLAFRLLGWMAAPIFVFYLLVSLKAQTEGNWAMAGTATLTPVAAWCVLDGVRHRRHAVRFLWGAACVMGAFCLLAFPLMRPLSQRPNIGPYIPIQRVSGMRDHAAAAESELQRIAETTGQIPFVLTDHYGRASLLAFYLDPSRTVRCAGSLMGGRRSQYDIWAETDLRQPNTESELLGRPALLFGTDIERFAAAFESVTPIEDLPGEPKPDQRGCAIGIGYRGFADQDTPRTGSGERTP